MTNRIYRGLMAVCVLGLIQLRAETPSPAPKEVPIVMYDFLGSLIRLQPYMVSEAKFKDPKNQKEIGERLSAFVDFSKRLSHSQRLDTPTFQMSASALQSHFGELHDVFASGRKDFARKMLLATLDGCGSCHSQLQQDSKAKFEFKSNELKGSSFDKGEFLFAVRHYDEALVAYNQVILEFNTGKGKDTQELEAALRRKLFVLVRAKHDSAKATEEFQKELKSKALPKNIRDQVEGWVAALKVLSTKKFDGSSAEALEALASKNIPPLLSGKEVYKPGSIIHFLSISGLIFKFINTRPSSEMTPGLLYWLAICDKFLNHGYFFSFSDTYLKECIQRFPKSPVAGKCYAELESTTMDSYTGSSGVNLPNDVKAELDRLKALLGKTAPAKNP